MDTERSFIRLTVLRRNFGLQMKNLSDRKVQVHLIDGVTHYDMDEVVAKCADKIILAFSPALTEEGQALADLKHQELGEKVRKLKLDNDVREGKLVSADKVRVSFGLRIKAMSAVLDAIVIRVKMEAPTVPQSVLDAVKRCVGEARNNAANHRLERDDG